MLEKFFGIRNNTALREKVPLTRSVSTDEAVSVTLNVSAVERAVRAHTDFLKQRSFDGGNTNDVKLIDARIAAIYAALAQEGIDLEKTSNYDGTENSLHTFVSAYQKALDSNGEEETEVAA